MKGWDFSISCENRTHGCDGRPGPLTSGVGGGLLQRWLGPSKRKSCASPVSGTLGVRVEGGGLGRRLWPQS